MGHSLEESFRWAACHLFSPWDGPTIIMAASKRLHGLPAALSRHFRLACPLAAPVSPTRRLVVKIATPEGRNILSGRPPAARLPDELSDGVGWRRARNFCAFWAQTSTALHRGIGSLWVAFDLGTIGTDPGEILFFLREGKEGSGQEVIVEQGLALLCDGRFGGEISRTLLSCLERVRPHADVLKVGISSAREVESVALGLHPRQQDSFLACLSAVGYRGPTEALDRLLPPLYRHARQVCLTVEIGEHVGSRLVIECFCNGVSLEAQARGWQSLLAHLVEDGRCAPEHRDALLRFTQHTIEDSLLQRVWFRKLHHIELVVIPERPIEVVAYVGVIDRPLAEFASRAEQLSSGEGALRGSDSRTLVLREQS